MQNRTKALVKKCIALGMAVMLLMSGCSYGQTGLEGLLKAPKLSGEQNDIYNALRTNAVGGNVRLHYPRTGDYTSAFVLRNMDDEPSEEAIVFYTSGSDNALRMNLLDREDGVWVSKYDMPCPRSASEIEKVGFIKARTRTFLLVGYNLINEEGQSIHVYDYEDGKLEEKTPISCMQFSVFDINADGEDELITITAKIPMGENSELMVLAECGKFSDLGRYEMVGATEMDPVVDEYADIRQGILGDGRPALYLDGERPDGTWSTEILAYDGLELRNFIYSEDVRNNLIQQTIRISGVESYDRNGDGWLQIPVRNPVPGSDDIEPNRREYFTSWYVYDIETRALVQWDTTYASYVMGCIFTIPKSWIGFVTADYSVGEDEVSFYIYAPDSDEVIGDELLSIKMVSREDYEWEVQNNGYQLLREKGQNIYLYQIYNTTSWMKISDLEVQAGFQFYNS